MVRSYTWAAGRMRSVAFAPGGSVVAGLHGLTLRVWDAATGAEVAARVPGANFLTGLAFLPDGRRLATVSSDQSVRMWDTATWAEVRGYSWPVGRLAAVAAAPDGLRLAAGGDIGEVVWDGDG